MIKFSIYPLFVSLFLIFLFSPPTWAQSIDNIRAEYDEKNGIILIKYNLSWTENKNDRFKVRAYYSQDQGKNYLPINEVSGRKNDLGDGIVAGDGKEIHWDYFVDDPDFDGKNVKFKIEAQWDKSFEVRRLEKLTGPEAALNSLIIPGWGNHKVTGEKGYAWLTYTAYGLVGAGTVFAITARNTHQKYLQANTPDEINLLNQANQQGKLALGLLAGGASIWLGNAIWVAIRGSKNKRKLQKLSPIAQANRLPLRWDYNPITRTNGFNFHWRF
jgi:hypothetical protein